MQNIQCPKCKTPNRSTARFCGKCGATLAGALPPTVPAVQPAALQSAAPVMPQYAPQFPAPFDAAQGKPQQLAPPVPVAQTVMPRVSAAIGKGCGAAFHSIARLFTRGGRAAYADLIAPEVVASGLVVSQPSVQNVSSPIEGGCFVWAGAWLLGALLLLVKDWWGIVIFIVLYLLLFALSWVGLRRPFFSRLTASTLANLFTGSGRGKQNQLEFALNTQNQGQVIVTMVGSVGGLTAQTMPQQQHAVQLWGIRTGAKTIRAWKLGFLGLDYKPANVELSTARLIPLTAALFIPVTFWLVIWGIVRLPTR